MMTRLLVALLSFSLAAAPGFSFAPQAATAGDPELEKGIRQAQQGEFEEAVITLDAVATRLAQGGNADELARAYLYLSIAYLGLSQEQKAKAQFLEAWRTDSGIELSASEFPPKILEFFEAAREEAVASGEIEGGPQIESTSTPEEMAAAEPVAETREPEQKKSKTLPILLGVGAAAAVGIAVAAGGGGGDSGGSGNGGQPQPVEVMLNIDSPNVPVEIPDLGYAVSQLTVSGSGTIVEATLRFNIAHTCRGDLTVAVLHPDNTPFALAGPRDCNDSWIEEVVMSPMAGKPAAGTWTFGVEDGAPIDSGVLNTWSLHLLVRR